MVGDAMGNCYGFYGDAILGGKGGEVIPGDRGHSSLINYPVIAPDCPGTIPIVYIDFPFRSQRTSLGQDHEVEGRVVIDVHPTVA